jgi:hypothetical protein
MPIYKGSEKIKDIVIVGQNTNCITHIPQDVKLTLDPLNATVVGSPTISNGVVSGFSTSNYLLTPKSVNLNSVNNWEIVIKAQYNTGSMLQQHSNAPFTIALTAGMMLVRLSGGSEWTTVYKDTSGLVTGNWYSIRASFDGSTYKFERAEDGGEYTVLKTMSNSTKIISNNQPFVMGTNDVHTDPFKGSIDLTQSYIKINNELWWKGGTGNLTLKAGSKVYVPNGFEKVTKYYKDVVTTKYWKEVTTGSRELEYACYTMFGDANKCAYVPYPLGGNTVYRKDTSWSKASKSSELVLTDSSSLFSAITEENVTYKNPLSGNQVCPRSYKNDLYKDTTKTETVEGTPEDYTYTTTETTTVEVSADDDWTRSEEVNTTVKKFDEVVVNNDANWYPSSTAGTRFGYYSLTSNRISNSVIGYTYSGNTSTMNGVTPQSYTYFYNTETNKMYTGAGGVWEAVSISLPVCLFTNDTNAKVTSINQVFNGFGYIGSTVFVLPNVKCLIPNGRNEDGSLNNIDFTFKSVYTHTSTNAAAKTKGFYINASQEIIGTSDGAYIKSISSLSQRPSTWTGGYCIYVEDENRNYINQNTNPSLVMMYADSTQTASQITSLKPFPVEGYTKPVHIDKVYKGSTLVYQGAYKTNQVVFEKSTAGTYSVNLEKAGLYEITVVGGGGAAAMRGVYDDRGYGWGGGSGGAFVGTFVLERGTRTVVVGKANNNTTAQTSNSQTSNPSDTKTYGSSVSGVVSVGGGGSGHYNSSYVGAAGAAATLTITPTSTTLNKAGNAGSSGSGGKGSAAAATVNGGASVYNGYGKGQGCKTSEYYTKRSWVNGTAGYVKIVYKGSRN